jgi:hypothetical protein
MSKMLMIAAALLTVTNATASAHSNDARLDEQAAAIEQGRRDGSITWREGRKLRKEQAAIERVQNELASDGRLSQREKRILHRMQDQSEGRIISESTDRWRRWWWLPRFGR